MGFGFNLFFTFILLPLIVILALVWLITKKKIFGGLISFACLSVLGIVLLIIIMLPIKHFFRDKKNLDTDDIYGKYIIDRAQYPGEQADWQYNHFRFEITEQDEFIFHVTENERIITSYRGTITFLETYKNPRIIIHVKEPRHHIIEEMPTLYRQVWSFYYVFKSPRFGNVFFKKGKWKQLDK